MTQRGRNCDYAGDVSEDGYDVIDISSDDEEAIVFGDGTVAISNSTTVIQKIVMTFTRRVRCVDGEEFEVASSMHQESSVYID